MTDMTDEQLNQRIDRLKRLYEKRNLRILYWRRLAQITGEELRQLQAELARQQWPEPVEE